jgi:outer membrane protein assembly factor BamA
VLILIFEVEEGDRYYFGDIRWVGNTVFPSDYLNECTSASNAEMYSTRRYSIKDYSITMKA